jgi:cysteinyl-tRNA synthetase
MDDDLSVPSALAVLHERVRAGNAALDDEDLETAATIRGEVTAMTDILGINPLSREWQATSTDTTSRALSALVERLVEGREAARNRKDFAEADRIRDELAAAGITIEDTSTGPHWSIE